jgi:hypothetical protein
VTSPNIRITNPRIILIWCCLQGKEENGDWDRNISLSLAQSLFRLTPSAVQISLEELREKGFATMQILQRGERKDARVYFPTDVPASLNTLPPEEVSQ